MSAVAHLMAFSLKKVTLALTTSTSVLALAERAEITRQTAYS